MASSIVKNNYCLWDNSLLAAAPPHTFDECIEQLRAGRKPPLNPDLMRSSMRADVADGALGFTSRADVEVVIEQYRIGFVRAFSSFQVLTGGQTAAIFYWGLGWGDEDGRVLHETLQYASEHCMFPDGPLDIGLGQGNMLSGGMKQSLVASAEREWQGKFILFV